MAWAVAATGQNFVSGSATTIAASAFTSTAGNLIVVGVRNSSSTISVSGIADTAGNTYALLSSGSALGKLEMWYCNQSLGNASNTVTVTFSSSASSRGVVVTEFSGNFAVSLQDNVGFTSSTGTTSVTSSAYNTLTAGALAVSVADINATATTWTAGTGFTIAVQDSSNVSVLEYQAYGSIQSGATASFSNANTTQKKQCTAVFTEAQGSGGGGTHAAVF